MTQELFTQLATKGIEYITYGITGGVGLFAVQYGGRKGFAWFKKLGR